MNFLRRKTFVFCKRNLFIIYLAFCFLLLASLNCNVAYAKPPEKIGVLYSYKNVEAYETNNIVGFYQLWKAFIETFEQTYLDYQTLCNISFDTKVSDIGLNIILYPLAVDISQEEINFLNEFLRSGKKVIITSGVGPPSNDLKNFLAQNSVVLSENVIAKETLNLRHKAGDTTYELPSGNFYSLFSLAGTITKVVAKWKETSQIAIGSTIDLIYIGYSWGQDINKNDDIKVLLKTIDYCWSGWTDRLTKEITKDEYGKLLKEILVLKEQAASVIQIANQLDLDVPRYLLRRHFEDGADFTNDFSSSYLFGDFKTARENANSAKNNFAIVYSLGIPVRKVEIRAIWLDRGTIVGIKNPYELTDFIKGLAKIGFNVIFFETINSGYPIYPSRLLPQNPLIKGWDPLKVAIEAAHSSGIELHAWVWTFAAGNTRHNLLIGKQVGYPGPIIEANGRSWALSGDNGALRIENQPEFWISPGNPKVCQFLVKLFSEIVTNYDVDGLQFDYIRFPFQKQYSQLGFDFVTRDAFKNVTGKKPEVEGPVNRVWKEWKASLINNFVRDTSAKLKSIKPNLKISAAVFALDRSMRLQLIQQDWETWVLNKWIDVVYPFYYSFAKEEIKTRLEREKQAVNDRAIIIPAFNLRVLSVGEVAERLTAARNAGTHGVALFAAEHLSRDKKDLLKKGPFREEANFIPYNKPFLACEILLDEFISIIEKLIVAKKISVLSDSQSQKEVYNLTQELKNDFRNYTPDKINDIEKKLITLQMKVQDWLSLEKYLNREQRAMYISSYLTQIKTLLNYVK